MSLIKNIIAQIEIENKIEELERKLHIRRDRICGFKPEYCVNPRGSKHGCVSAIDIPKVDGVKTYKIQGHTVEVADRPECGKIYALTGGPETPSIAGGYSWSDSEVAE